MKTLTSLPRSVRSIEHTWIPMRDGVRLGAKAWVPEGAETDPVPAILEYIPYRKRDLKRTRDATIHPYMAGHGYACIRVDIRGSGDSEGVLTDEYLQQELDDGVEILRWLAEQPWCNGDVGMIGISWGGFNGLQIAAMQPPELKAVISICSTDDRYADDVHYMGGCLLGDNLSWASVMFAHTSLPPDPAIVGDRWREMWQQRLEGSGLWLETWLRHQHRDDYWRHGSICEDFDAVQCPVMAVSGWADGYTNAVFRLLANLRVPRLGLVGPWSHKYPHVGEPGPAIGFLQEALRWWDRWLKGIDTGIMEEPMLRAWMQDSVPPTPQYRMRPGRWVGEPSWPSPQVERWRLALGERRLAAVGEPGDSVALSVQSPLSVGLFAGKWCSYAATPDLPHDQREEDGGALVFDSEPLASALEILGAAEVELEVSSSERIAMVAARLSDVAPDDKATRITYGVLNLTHRDGHAQPELLEPGQAYRVRVQLNHIGQSIPAGHRLRLAISTSYWPLAWAPPQPVRLTIHTGQSALHLPMRPQREQEDEALRPFGEPEGTPPPETSRLEPPHHNWWVKRDLARDESTLEVIKDEGIYRIDELDLAVRDKTLEWYSYRADDFASPRGETHAVRGLEREGWSITTMTRTVLTCDATDFYLRAELDAYEGDKRVFCKSWDRRIPRNLV